MRGRHVTGAARLRAANHRPAKEFDRESGLVVEVSRVQSETAAGNARVRIKLLGISAKLAPHVSPDVRTLIDHEIRQALEELSEYDDAGNLISPEAAA